jgi:thiamine biosynthesis lipoprotein
MACDVTVLVRAGCVEAETAIDEVVDLFAAVERECTRFDPDSPLMHANRAGNDWYPVPDFCFKAVAESAAAYEYTDGLFDPRVLRTLTALGYDRSLPFETGNVAVDGFMRALPSSGRWHPGIDDRRHEVRIGENPIDLGGIGKGLALRWSAERLRSRLASFLIEAGGDCYLSEDGPEDGRWHVGIEDPAGGTSPLAVLRLSGTGCATSSIRVRRWEAAGQPVHHLIDPRTGAPSRSGLLSVTVVHPDPAAAEVWAKVLFLHGLDDITRAAAAHGLAALWVADDGTMECSDPLSAALIWRADR